MKKVVYEEIVNNDILIMSAAVADYRPTETSKSKLKKEEKIDNIKLTRQRIFCFLLKDSGKKVIGFGSETNDEENNAFKS